MPLNVGDRLGHYNVTAFIGESSMGPTRLTFDEANDDFPRRKLKRESTPRPNATARRRRTMSVTKGRA